MVHKTGRVSEFVMAPLPPKAILVRQPEDFRVGEVIPYSLVGRDVLVLWQDRHIPWKSTLNFGQQLTVPQEEQWNSLVGVFVVNFWRAAVREVSKPVEKQLVQSIRAL